MHKSCHVCHVAYSIDIGNGQLAPRQATPQVQLLWAQRRLTCWLHAACRCPTQIELGLLACARTVTSPSSVGFVGAISACATKVGLAVGAC